VQPGQPLRIGIFIFEECEELDWAGPWEVLAYWAKNFPDDRVEVFTLARSLEQIRCAKGLRVLPDHSWETAPPIDVLVFPGGAGTRRQLGDELLRGWVQAIAATGALMTSVCTGALVFADSGLLHGRPATTHWSALELLGQLDPTVELRPDDRFVDTGDVITAAGVSAGIDMALHLVRRLHSEERAKEVKRGIQYDPQSPV